MAKFYNASSSAFFWSISSSLYQAKNYFLCCTKNLLQDHLSEVYSVTSCMILKVVFLLIHY